MLAAANRSRRRLAPLAALGLVAAVVVGPASPAGGAPASRPQGTIVFASARSGNLQIYSVRADGSRLGQLTRNGAQDTDPIFSPDGRRILFVREQHAPSALWVMNADGSGQRKFTSGFASDAAWSPDSRRFVYRGEGNSKANSDPLVIVRVDGGGRIIVRGRNSHPSWSPDGRWIAFAREVLSTSRTDLVVVGKDGRGLRTILRNIAYQGVLGWSPRGQIAFGAGRGLEVVDAGGRGRRRLVRSGGPYRGFAWAPDGRRFALVDAAGRLRVAYLARGGARDITPKGAGRLDSPAWSPHGRWLAVRSFPRDAVYADLVLVAADGSSSRPLTKRIPYPWGSENGPPSWRQRGASPARLGGAPAAPLPSETVSASRFQTAGPGTIKELAADGRRAAVIVAYGGGCTSIEAWEPARPRVVWLQRPCVEPAYIDVTVDEGPEGVALAGTRVGWLHRAGGNLLYSTVETATLTRPTPVWLTNEISDESDIGAVARRPFGHGGLLAFTIEQHCDADAVPASAHQCPPGRKTGDVVAATVWRVGRPGRCPERHPRSPGCTRVAQADGELGVLAVDSGRIAARTGHGVRLLTAGGNVLRDFAVEASAAALSGKLLAVQTANAVELYDTDSGRLAARIPVPSSARLADVEGDILVTASGKTVTLRRVGDGRTTTIHTAGTAWAQLEAPGLFVAGGRSVTFTPMRDVRRRLGG